MEVRFLTEPSGREVVQIDGASIIFRNFSGANTQYSQGFNLMIDDPDIADEFVEHGYNVVIKIPEEPGATPMMRLPIKLKFKKYPNGKETGPLVFLVKNGVRRELHSDDMDILDKIDITNVNMDIRPYDWERNGDRGRSAWLNEIEVTQRVSRFEKDDGGFPYEE